MKQDYSTDKVDRIQKHLIFPMQIKPHYGKNEPIIKDKLRPLDTVINQLNKSSKTQKSILIVHLP